MPYTNCSACGAKALVGATRCPRCQVPFVSYDPKGERVETVNCPNCGVQRPVAIGVCPNCLTSTAPAGARLARGLTRVAIAIAVMVAVGYLISQRVGRSVPMPSPIATDSIASVQAPALGDSASASAADSAIAATSPSTPAMPSATLPSTPSATVPVTPTVAPPTVARSTAATAAMTPSRVPVDPAMVPPKPAPPKPAPPPSVAVSDDGPWEYAMATTWVRVRSAPTRESEVLRMVDSAQRVRLGPPQNGWRPIRVGVDRGWVDPRLFTVLPPR